MPQEASKVADPDADAKAAAEAVAESSNTHADDADAAESGDESGDDAQAVAGDAAEGEPAAQKKKKRNRKRKIKDALTGKGKEPAAAPASADTPVGHRVNEEQLKQILDANPALKRELLAQQKGPDGLKELMKKTTLNELMTGLSVSGKNVKDMGAHAFWKTQPVPSFDDMAAGKDKIVDGPIKEIAIERVSKDPKPMHADFEWDTLDLENDKQLEEVYDLLTNHYVEDNEAMFRFRYSTSFLNWALKAPGWRKEWHVGVRTKKGGKLVAFISGIPIDLRIREKTLKCSEVNFLCVHRKLRSKRLAPVLIAEITRRCYLVGVYQAVYTVGSLLPTPVSTCRYFHRALDWEKLYDVGFSPLPAGSTKMRQVVRYKLPEENVTPGLRVMEAKDVEAVADLLKRYLERLDMAQVFTKEEFEHWMFPKEKPAEQVVWCYVVEDPQTKKVTDFVSFYNLESSVLNNPKHNTVRAAYLFYYATEAAFDTDKGKLKPRLNSLIKDALIEAKKVRYIFRSLTCIANGTPSRPSSTSSTRSPCSTTLSSSKNSALVRAMVRCTTTCTTTVLRRLRAVSIPATSAARSTWAELVWSCSKEGMSKSSDPVKSNGESQELAVIE